MYKELRLGASRAVISESQFVSLRYYETPTERREEAHLQGKSSVSTGDKKRRLHLKMKNDWVESSSGAKEGLTYVSGKANTMERAAEAARGSSWLPEPKPLLPNCRPVIVDTETAGLAFTDNILQIAAKCSDKEFTVFIEPKGKFSPNAAKDTGMSSCGGKLFRHGIELPIVPAAQACLDFLYFLDFFTSCAQQVVLVGHNFIRFDGPRLMKLLAEHHLAKSLCLLTFGLTDTLPLISQGNVKKQEVLARTFLKGDEWQNLVSHAHDALADCVISQGLLDNFEITDVTLTEAVLPVRDFMERCAANRKKRELKPQLMAMKPHGVSESMIGKMAAQGVTPDELVSEYQAHGQKGLEVCLGVQLNGKPRVTKSKKVVNQIEQYLKTQAEVPK